jgi:hypothetical protein
MAEVFRTNTTNYVHPQETNLLNVHKAMQYNTDGEPELRVTLGQTVSNADWYLQVAMGNITGARGVFKAGYNGTVGSTEESLWAHSELYPWSAWNSGGTLSCVSASASDTGTLEIVGLRTGDWAEITETVTMTGTTPAVTTNSFIRINSVHYSSNVPNAGEIHVNRNGTCVGHLDVGNGFAQMAQYTVPAGHTAYILSGTANIGKGNDGTGKFKYRPYGGSFQTAMIFMLYQSTFHFDFKAPLVIPEKTDIDVTLVASNSNTPVTCAYSMVLIANSVI